MFRELPVDRLVLSWHLLYACWLWQTWYVLVFAWILCYLPAEEFIIPRVQVSR